MSEKENPWSEDETDTGTTTETNEPIEVDDDVSHEASEKDTMSEITLAFEDDGPKAHQK
jgi:hypothetical protein